MIGKRLREARKAANMTQGELSIKAGLDDGSNSKISHYETERYQPHYKTVCLLASILDVPECYFYCRDESMAENILAIHKKISDTISHQQKLTNWKGQKNNWKKPPTRLKNYLA